MFIALLIIFAGCTNQPEKKTLNSNIILVNAGNSDRVKLSAAIRSINECRPKVVGVNFVFEDGNVMSSDTLLANSLNDAGNVVLVSLMAGDSKIVTSDSLFVKHALAEGLLYYGFDENDNVKKHMLYVSVGDELFWSFPTTLASYYDIEHSDEIMNGAAGNTYYEIAYNGDQAFKILDIDKNMDCSQLQDKIVLVGYLGPETEDMYPVGDGESKYSTWILANCVENIINRRFVKAD